MSARLPIARAFLDGAGVRLSKAGIDSAEITPAVPELATALAETLRVSTFFDVQVSSDICLSQGRDYDLESSFGPLRLPYPDVWMEWQVRDNYGVIQMAAAVSERRACDANPGENQGLPGDFRIRYQVFMRIPDQGDDINAIRLWPHFDVGADGRYTSGSRKTLGHNDDLDAPAIRLCCEEAMATTLLALSLMNCKNVTTQESGRVNIGRSGADKRRGKAARTLRYHTIILPGGGSEREGAGHATTHRAAAIHRVRGHFKTFTTERPLLGKHVGTYWWGWQVRGSKDSGLVVADYQLGKAAAS